MKFLGNKPPPIGHEQILSAIGDAEMFSEGELPTVDGVRPEHVTQWFVRCWTWSGVPPHRFFRYFTS